MRGKKYDDETKEKALALLATDTGISDASNELGIPRRTLVDWKAQAITANDDNHFAELRKERREQFINNAWNCLEKALALANRRVLTALECEEELGKIVDDIKGLSGKEIDEVTRWNVINKLNSVKLQSVKDLATLISICYDKAALASGDETERLGINLSVETMVRELRQLNTGQEN